MANKKITRRGLSPLAQKHVSVKTLVRNFDKEKPSIALYVIAENSVWDLMHDKHKDDDFDSLNSEEKQKYNEDYKKSQEDFEEYVVNEFVKLYYSDDSIKNKCKGESMQTIENIAKVMTAIAKGYDVEKYAMGGTAGCACKHSGVYKNPSAYENGGGIDDLSQTWNVELYFKDAPDDILERTIQLGEEGDDDDEIFFYVESEDELNKLKDENNGEDFVVVSISDKFKDGGKIKDQYKGLSESNIWSEWTIKQRAHFLNDHEEQIRQLYKNEGNENTELNSPEWATSLYFELPSAIKQALKEHKSEGEYAEGGGVRKFKKGDKVKTREGNIETVVRINSNGNVETLENDYSWSPESLKLESNGKKLAEGGRIPNNYKGKTAEKVWNDWTKSQKEHFLSDHDSSLSSDNLAEISHLSYGDLPSEIETKLWNHVNSGQYAEGGGVENEWVVEYLLSNEDEYKVEKGFFSKEEAEKWAKGENLYNRSDEIDVHILHENEGVNDILKEYNKLTAINDHTGAALLLINEFGTDAEKYKINEIINRSNNYVSAKDIKERDEMSNKYYYRLKNKYANGGRVGKKEWVKSFLNSKDDESLKSIIGGVWGESDELDEYSKSELIKEAMKDEQGEIDYIYNNYFGYANGGSIGEGKNGYVAFYKGKQMDVYADTSLQARDKAAKEFKAKKAWDVTVVLAEKEGEQVTHSTAFSKGGGVDSDWGMPETSPSNNKDYNDLYSMFPDDHKGARAIWLQLSDEQKEGFLYDLEVTDAASEHMKESWLEFVNSKSEKEWLKNATNWDEMKDGGGVSYLDKIKKEEEENDEEATSKGADGFINVVNEILNYKNGSYLVETKEFIPLKTGKESWKLIKKYNGYEIKFNKNGALDFGVFKDGKILNSKITSISDAEERVDGHNKKQYGYSNGGAVKSKTLKKYWIADALSGGKNKGALKRTALRKHLIRKTDEKLSNTDLNKLEKMGGATGKRAHLAKTLKKFKH